MKQLLLLVFVSVLMAGCSENSVESGSQEVFSVDDLNDPVIRDRILTNAQTFEELEVRGSGQERVLQKGSSPYSGWVKTFHDGGKLDQLTYYKNGKPDRFSIGWHPNGQKASECHYENGKKEGPFLYWHSSGLMGIESFFKDGKIEGVSTDWDLNGKIESEEVYVNGVKTSEILYTDGVKFREATFSDGKMTSHTRYEDGKKVER